MRYAIGKVSGVFIEQDVVTKIFGIRGKGLKPVRGTIQDCYARENECLIRLKNKIGFPQVIKKYDDIKAIRLENVGESLLHTWHEYDLTQFINQAHKICDRLEEANIQYFHARLNPEGKPGPDFPLSNLCINEGELSLIDFEMANPVGHYTCDNWHPKMVGMYGRYDPKIFREFFIEGLQNPHKCFKREIWRKIVPGPKKHDTWVKMIDSNPREVYKSMTKFTKPNDKVIGAWKSYQKRFGKNETLERIETIGIKKYINKSTKLLDIGCNDGYFSMELAPLVNSVTGVEPHVELPDPLDNVTWQKKDFNTFCEKQDKTYNVLLSLAVSIQLRDFGGITEQQIVDRYYDLLESDGLVIHETQKLADRPNNQEHTKQMVDAFNTKFTQLEHGRARKGGGREYYVFRKN